MRLYEVVLGYIRLRAVHPAIDKNVNMCYHLIRF